MEDYYMQTLTISTFALIFSSASKNIKDKLHLPESFISLMLGFLAGKHDLQVIEDNPCSLFFIARMILSIQTVNVALSLSRRYVSEYSSSLVVLVLILGCIKCLFTNGLFVYLKLLAYLNVGALFLH